MLSDADISVEPDHLKRVVAELTTDEKTGITLPLSRAAGRKVSPRGWKRSPSTPIHAASDALGGSGTDALCAWRDHRS